MLRNLTCATTTVYLFAALPSFAQSDWHNGFEGHMMGGYGHGIFGGLAMILFWVVTVALIVLAVRWIGDRDKGSNKSGALDILKERLARGEIDPEEYELRRKALEG